jgi:KDO2-lipid IV(A) lauroyltransferase
LSAHYGNPEVAMQVMLPLGIEIFAVTEPIEPPRLAKLLNEVRSTQGIEFKPVGLPSVKRIIQTIRAGHCVALMGDRDIEGPRMRLPFLGEETWMPTGPIELAIRNDVPVFPCFSMRRGKYRFEGACERPLRIERTGDLQADTRAAMLQYIERLEARLRAEPEQWAVLERLWDDPAGRNTTAEADTVAA